MSKIEEVIQDTYKDVLDTLNQRADMNIDNSAYQMAREDFEACEEILANVNATADFQNKYQKTLDNAIYCLDDSTVTNGDVDIAEKAIHMNNKLINSED